MQRSSFRASAALVLACTLLIAGCGSDASPGTVSGPGSSATSRR